MDGEVGFVEAKGGGLCDDGDALVLDPDFRVSFDQAAAVDMYWHQHLCTSLSAPECLGKESQEPSEA